MSWILYPYSEMWLTLTVQLTTNLENSTEDTGDGCCFKQQRALLWHAIHFRFLSLSLTHAHREAIVYSLWRTTDTASQPTPALSRLVAPFAVPVYINTRLETSRVAALPSEQHRHFARTRTPTGASPRRENEMMMVRWVEGRGSAGDRDHFLLLSLSLSQWCGNSVRACDLICLPACFPPCGPRGEMERFSSDSGRPVLRAKIGLMNKPWTMWLSYVTRAHE